MPGNAQLKNHQVIFPCISFGKLDHLLSKRFSYVPPGVHYAEKKLISFFLFFF